MSTESNSSGGIGLVGVLIGASIVAALGYFVMNGTVGGKSAPTVNIEMPKTVPAPAPK